MKQYDRILSATQEGPFLRMIERGMTPNDIKEAIIESLDPYFENKKILKTYSVNLLLKEGINLSKLKNDVLFFENFKRCLLTYHSAKMKDSNACFGSCALWQNEIEKSLSEYWSLFNLEVNKSTLKNEDFILECFRNIGGIIEGVIKPYLQIFLYQVKIAKGIKTNLDDIKLLKLGNIIQELIDKSQCSDLFVVAPTEIKLHQWRNIAYHHSARIENGGIICCWYGEGRNLKYFRCSRNELLQIVRNISKILSALKLAHTLFFIDNLNEIIKFSPSGDIREEAEVLTFITGLNSQGFEIVKFEKNENEAFLVVRDALRLLPYQRLSHISQFIYLLWILTRSNQLIIDYYDHNNTPSFRLCLNSEICEKVYNGELDELILPKTMEIIDLKKIKN